MNDVITLDEKYSTTRRMIEADPQAIAGLVKQANKPEEKFETVLFLPEGDDRQGEGGLRTKGYFKVGGIIPSNDATSLTSNAKPLITVVTVVFNGEKFLDETILSVINQTYDNVEYIIIDGGSTDGTLDIIKKHEHAIDYWVSEKDSGIYDAMNKGCVLAFGYGVNFLNAGDYFVGNVFSSRCQIPYFIRCKVKKKSGEIVSLSRKNYKLGMPTSHQAIVYRNNKHLYDLDYLISSDYDFSLINGVFDNAGICTDGYVVYDNMGSSSVNYRSRDMESLFIIYNNFGFIFAALFFIKQFPKMLIKRFLKWQ